ncbi:MAG TPA: hypothetical protein VI818_03605, partial [Candidatus Thermoplasmatota archaeon]|nr:hypothetical protein [Candidatus Thermoplasmatota archaeon]
MRWFLGKPDADTPSSITPLPPVEAPLSEVTTHEFEPGTTYARILYDPARARHMYQAIEPPLSEKETKALAFVKEVLVRTLDADLEMVARSASPESLKYLDERVRKVVREYHLRLDATQLQRVSYYLRRDFVGYGPIDLMMHDPDIEDISCDGAKAPIFLYHRKHGSLETNVRFPGPDQLDGFVIRMA